MDVMLGVALANVQRLIVPELMLNLRNWQSIFTRETVIHQSRVYSLATTVLQSQ